VWDTKTITDIRKEGVSRSTLAAIDGLLLRGRSFRFAVLNGSRLYAADLAYTDLSGASLQLAILSGAQLDSTKLRDADMENADLRGAYLGYADLKGANLAGARLDGIIGTLVDLQGATLLGASLSGASLHFASLAGADLNYAKLSGADLFEADLRGSNLREARLQGASLTAAHLQGAYLRRANMLGADLSDADLHGAYLADARLWNVGAKGKPANFSLADARNVDFETAPTDEDRSDLSETLSNVPDVHDFIPREARRRLEDVLAHEPHGKFEYLASRERPVLVSMNPEFGEHPEWLIGKPTAAYIAQLVRLLTELAAIDPVIAAGVARRAINMLRDVPHEDPLPISITCRLLTEANAGRVKLRLEMFDELAHALKRAKLDCPITEPATSGAK
jgi:uncharacterized protein YjbI with pentapeptide repeats